MNRMACCLALLLALTGCRSLTRTIEVPVYVHDTAYTVKEVRDSTYIDRWHTIEVKGDTVRLHDSVVVVRYKVVTDTAHKYVEVPVVVRETETIEVARPLTWWQQTKQKGFWCLLAAVLVYVMWRTRRLWLKYVVPISV